MSYNLIKIVRNELARILKLRSLGGSAHISGSPCLF